VNITLANGAINNQNHYAYT